MKDLWKQLRELPDHMVGEIVGGELYASPRPASPHARAAASLDRQLGGPFDDGRGGPGGWWILVEPELHLGEDVLVPDLAGWRRERMPEIPDVPHFSLAPDWICEVVSPATAALDRVRKLPRYSAAGVSHAWMVDPRARTVEVYERSGGAWKLVAAAEGEGNSRLPPFEAVEVALALLWIPTGVAEGP